MHIYFFNLRNVFIFDLKGGEGGNMKISISRLIFLKL